MMAMSSCQRDCPRDCHIDDEWVDIESDDELPNSLKDRPTGGSRIGNRQTHHIHPFRPGSSKSSSTSTTTSDSEIPSSYVNPPLTPDMSVKTIHPPALRITGIAPDFAESLRKLLVLEELIAPPAPQNPFIRDCPWSSPTPQSPSRSKIPVSQSFLRKLHGSNEQQRSAPKLTETASAEGSVIEASMASDKITRPETSVPKFSMETEKGPLFKDDRLKETASCNLRSLDPDCGDTEVEIAHSEKISSIHPIRQMAHTRTSSKSQIPISRSRLSLVDVQKTVTIPSSGSEANMKGRNGHRRVSSVFEGKKILGTPLGIPVGGAFCRL
jgi:hypothetical protein